MLNQNIGRTVIYISECDSTNSLIKEQLSNFESGTCVYTDNQKAGRGQFKNSWHTTPFLNITASVLIRPYKLPIENQFILSIISSLAIYNYLNKQGIKNVEIKWPNDILINRKKVAGILIENTIQDAFISHSIIGIGLNVNEIFFPSFERSATSLKLETGKEYDIKLELDELLKSLNSYYEKWLVVGNSKLEEEYLKSVYGFNEWVEIEDAEGKKHVKITGIDKWGRIKTKQPDGLSGCYDLKEIKFLY